MNVLSDKLRITTGGIRNENERVAVCCVFLSSFGRECPGFRLADVEALELDRETLRGTHRTTWEVLDVIARTRAVTLRPAGVDINLGIRHDPVSLLEMMDRCARDGVPFTIGPDSRTAVTATDPSSSTPRYGVMNLVGAMLVGSGRRHDERMELLLDEDPDSFEIGFAGMRWRGAPVGSGTSLGDGRDPLLSIGSVDPDDAILAIGEIISTG